VAVWSRRRFENRKKVKANLRRAVGSSVLGRLAAARAQFIVPPVGGDDSVSDVASHSEPNG